MLTVTITRSDMACAVRAVVRFWKKPGLDEKKAVLKGIQYLLHTNEWGIKYAV